MGLDAGIIVHLKDKEGTQTKIFDLIYMRKCYKLSGDMLNIFYYKYNLKTENEYSYKISRTDPQFLMIVQDLYHEALNEYNRKNSNIEDGNECMWEIGNYLRILNRVTHNLRMFLNLLIHEEFYPDCFLESLYDMTGLAGDGALAVKDAEEWDWNNLEIEFYYSD